MMGNHSKRRAGTGRRIRVSLCALVMALSIGATPAYADNGDEDVAEDTGPSSGRVAWDVSVLRPMNFIRLAVGCVLMVPVSFLALPGGIDNIQNMADYFIDQPYWDTFERPLGKF